MSTATPANFHAYRVHQDNETGAVQARFESLTLAELSPGEVVIRAAWSGINYKDALAVTGKGKILRRFPLVAGIDVAGVVETSEDARFRPGDEVLVTGCGLGENHDGGYSEIVRVPGDWVIPVPAGLSLREAMAIGTAGFTAALAIERMETNGQTPGLGPIAVTGASGGVGSLAVDMLAGAGYEVHAITGKVDSTAYLEALGAAAVIDRKALEMGGRPLERALWGGAIDSLGGEVLAWLTRTTRGWGNIASIGLAAGHTLNTTVMPFILRGVSLLGINSVEVPRPLREKVWARLAGDLRPRHLEQVASECVDFADMAAVFERLLAVQVTGRLVVKIAS